MNLARVMAFAASAIWLAGFASQTCAESARPTLAPLPFMTMWGSLGSGEGQIQDALKLSVTPTGDVYVADMSNSRIQQFTPQGAFVRAWSVTLPWGIAVSKDGFVYVCTNNEIHRFSSSGVYEYSWGSFGSLEGQLHNVQDVAVDAEGNVYAAELTNHRIQKFTSSGVFVRTWALQGFHAGYPKGITVGPDGFVYVSDAGNSTIQKFSPDGDFITAWGLPDGVLGESNRLGRPAVDSDGNVYVPDGFASRIVVFSGEGEPLTAWGSYGTGPGQFKIPTCAAFDANDHLYVMDEWNYRVQVFGLVPTAVDGGEGGHPGVLLGQPAPNPMRDAMRVRLGLQREGSAELSVFDISGRLVARMLEGRQSAGSRELTWDGRDREGRSVASGVYFLRLASTKSLCRRFVVLR